MRANVQALWTRSTPLAVVSKRMIKRLMALAILSLLFVLPTATFASAPVPGQTLNPGSASPKQELQSNPFNKNLVGEVSGFLPTEYNRTDDPIVLTIRIIRIALTFVGVGLTGLLVYAGFLWMTAAGNDDQITTSKSTMKNAVIGLLIIMMSWTLATFIINRIRAATRAGATRLETSSFGSSVIEPFTR